MNEDFEITLKYLDLLEPPEPGKHTEHRVEHWCGVPDRKDETKLYQRAKFATLADMLTTLPQWGEMGLGICIAVNKLTPNTEKRRSPNGWAYEIDTRYIEQVTGVRALFADLDTVGELPDFPIDPTMIVETSSGKFHCYWCIDKADPLPIEEFKALQLNIAALYKPYGADPSAADLNRVLRLPGSLHRKSMPRLVQIIDATGSRYGATVLREAFVHEPILRSAQKFAEPWDGVVPRRTRHVLEAMRRIYGEPNRPDGWNIACPWEHEHSPGKGSESATTYFLPNELNGGNGMFKCFHGHCAHRQTFEFHEWIVQHDQECTNAKLIQRARASQARA